MSQQHTTWSKPELQTYILLLCAKVDHAVSKEELDLIKTKVARPTFRKMYEEIQGDSEDESLDKIQWHLGAHEYSNREIQLLKADIKEVFASDRKLLVKESSLEAIFDNILY
ncbi:MAG: hypothetical protein CL867_00950 [Cytophagaceae bacterium]|nr:hypothetical protein [Cytophagaceae bacterium]